MKINSVNSNLTFKNNLLDVYSESKDVQLKERWSRKKCNTGVIMLSSALVSSFASESLTDLYIKKVPNTKLHPLSINARIGIGILALGAVSAFIFNKIDEVKNTKFGDVAYKMFNGPHAK